MPKKASAEKAVRDIRRITCRTVALASPWPFAMPLSFAYSLPGRDHM